MAGYSTFRKIDMTTLTPQNHTPANPDKFEFDAQVSEIFPKMAKTAIPNFYEAHLMHARMIDRVFHGHRPDNVVDIGASRGAFAEALHKAYGHDKRITMIDASPHMIEHLRGSYGDTHTLLCEDISEPFWRCPQDMDVAVLNYVLQFVRPTEQERVLSTIARSVKEDGVLIIGQKEGNDGTDMYGLLHEQYIRFRMDHGYSRESIEAKTRALQNAMWPASKEWLLCELARYGYSVRETTRHSVFATYFCIRDGGINGIK